MFFTWGIFIFMPKPFPRFEPGRLRTLREFNNLSPESFGKKIGKSKLTIMGWEKGKTLPGIKDIHRISEIFNVHPLSFWVTKPQKVAV